MIDDDTWWHIANSILQQVGESPAAHKARLDALKQEGLPPDHAVDKILEEGDASG